MWVDGRGKTYDILLGLEGRLGGRVDDEPTTRQTFTTEIVRVALELDSDAWGEEGAERLAGGSLGRDVDRVLRQALLAILLGDVVGERGAQRAVGVDHVTLDADGKALEERGLRKVKESARRGRRKCKELTSDSSMNLLSRRT